MATSQVVWFAANSTKYFPTQAEAIAYEKQEELSAVIITTGLNKDAADKVVKALLAVYNFAKKPVV